MELIKFLTDHFKLSQSQIDLIQKEIGIPVTSAAVCTTYEMMKKLGIEAKSAIGGELLSGKY